MRPQTCSSCSRPLIETPFAKDGVRNKLIAEDLTGIEQKSLNRPSSMSRTSPQGRFTQQMSAQHTTPLRQSAQFENSKNKQLSNVQNLNIESAHDMLGGTAKEMLDN